MVEKFDGVIHQTIFLYVKHTENSIDFLPKYDIINLSLRDKRKKGSWTHDFQDLRTYYSLRAFCHWCCYSKV
nr:MAG TPA: hypothetical protein [Caudoviricetes sp.]